MPILPDPNPHPHPNPNPEPDPNPDPDQGFQDKLPAEDCEALKAATAEALEWLEENQSADKVSVPESLPGLGLG